MTKSSETSESFTRKHVSLVYLLGIFVLGGYFWPAITSILDTGTWMLAASWRDHDPESASNMLHWSMMMAVIKLTIVVVALAIWLVYGQRLRQHHPRVAMALVIVAILPYLFSQLLFAYAAIVHGMY